MGEKRLVVLADNSKFAIIKEFDLPTGKYCFAVGVNEKEDDLNGTYCFFEEKIVDGKKYLEEVKDPEIISQFNIDLDDFE